MLDVSALSWMKADKPILCDLTVTLNRGDLLAIVGPNGAGKSSFLRCCLGWITPTSGQVELGGQAVKSLTHTQRAARLAWLPQQSRASESLPILEVVSHARFRFSETRSARMAAAQQALDVFGMGSMATRMWHTLSGGELQRVNLASLLAQKADLWLLDEPANHLDPAVQLAVYGQLVEHWMGGQTLVLITHDLNLLLSTVPATAQDKVKILGLKDGKQSFLTPLSSSHLPKQLADLYGVQIEEVTVFGRRQWVMGAND
jgi:iron complex transport system ATP-binding protein